LVLLLAVALVFGAYYVWQGVQTFMRTGGLGVVEATERAQEIRTATAIRVTERATVALTLFPTATPPPSCTDFRVIVPAAIVREGASTSSAVVTQFTQGTMVCVLSHEGEWYSIDLNPSTRRIEPGYMHEVLIEADNPTLTPSITPTPSDTVTPAPTVTPIPATITPSPLPSYTRDPRDTNTPLPTLTLTPTPSNTPPLFQSA
jgi:hypothetical protein